MKKLSDRQYEILCLITEGKRVSQVAKELYLGQSTVRTHIKNLLVYLDANTQAQAVANAYKRGILKP